MQARRCQTTGASPPDSAGVGTLARRRLLKEYAQHYSRGRPATPLARPDLAPSDERPVRLIAIAGGRVKARPVLGGLLYEYELEAA